MTNQTITISDSPRTRGATLVETVIVTLCLAALIPVLLAAIPEFGRPNREAMCAYRLGRIGSAMTQYTIENENYLPGSPGTSGAQLIFDYPNSPADSVDMPTDVTQTWDWAGPLANYFDISLDPNRATRMEQLRNGHFWCPSNNYTAVPYAGDPAYWKSARMISYNSMRDMLYYGDNAPLDPALENYARYSPGLEITIPSDYQPKINQVGNPSEKAYLADGSRFTIVSGDNIIIDYDPDYKGRYGGAFATGGPTLPEIYLRSYFLEEPARDVSYRHRHGETPGINVTHFDGHVEWVSEPNSRLPDRWYPTGTLISRVALSRLTRSYLPRDVYTGPGYTYPVN